MRHLHYIIEVPTKMVYSRSRIYPERKWPEQYEADHLYEQYTCDEDNNETEDENHFQ